MAKQTNLSLHINTDFYYFITVYNQAETEVVDITTWGVSWMLKAHPQDTDAIITKVSANGISLQGTYNISPSVNTQKAVVGIVDTDTLSLTPGEYFWEFKRTDADNETILGYGTLDLKASVHAN